ncbi:MAG TPA: hypothetical protein VIK07_10515 [Bacteroidales bacterium]
MPNLVLAMPELSLNNINQISSDVSNQEITFSHLLEDLTDHICCDVENEMQRGLSFADAYQVVKNKMGSRRIKEIQEETLYAVDTKYRNMKKMMKISGVVGTILMGFAALFKIQHWPFAGIMLTLGALILAFVFMPSALGVLWKETHNRKKLFLFISAFFAGMFFILGIVFKIQHWPGAGIILLLATISGILFFVPSLLLFKLMDPEYKRKRAVYIFGASGIIYFCLGLLFKIQQWPMANVLMTLGVVILCVVAFPWFTWLTWRNERYVKFRFIFVMIATLLIIFPGVLLNLSLQNSYEKGYFPQLQQQQVMYQTLYANNKSILEQYRDSSSYQMMGQLHAKTAGLISLIGNMQTKMVAESEGKPGVPALNPAQITQTDMGPEIKCELLSNPFFPSPVINFLLPGCKPREELISTMNEYQNYLSNLNSGIDVEKFKDLLDPSLFLPGKITNADEVSLMSGLHSLQLLKNSVLTVESYILRSVAKK